MTLQVSDEQFDVAVVAGPNLDHWPSVGVKTLSAHCNEMGLTVGQFGGAKTRTKGVLPLGSTGGIVLVEDDRGHIRRIVARSIVRFHSAMSLPDPFPGCDSKGLIPIESVVRMQSYLSQLSWRPTTAILGTGNRALRLGSSLIEEGLTEEVVCLEIFQQWGGKRFSAWEVERRRFEMLGGKILEALPLELSQKSVQLWQFKVKDSVGVRVLDVSRVVSAGPFAIEPDVREHPPGSLLFETLQSSQPRREDDVEGWSLEEERGRWIAGKIARELSVDISQKKRELDQVYKRARHRLKRYRRHYTEPHLPFFDGKWVEREDSKKIRSFVGVPQKAHRVRLVASLECFENIPCNLCEKSCPESAIKIKREPKEQARFLLESDCTACGACLKACPSGATLMFHEKTESMSSMVLPWRGAKKWATGEFALAVSRRGEMLGTVRVLGTLKGDVASKEDSNIQLVEVEVPTHLVWEVRGLRRKPQRLEALEDEQLLGMDQAAQHQGKVPIYINEMRRLIKEGRNLGQMLFELGLERNQDALLCSDGSCGLCAIQVNGKPALACQTKVVREMKIETPTSRALTTQETYLCRCRGIEVEEARARLRQGRLSSPEAVISATGITRGECHGQLCSGSFRRLLAEERIDSSDWIDWQFPSVDWKL